MIGDGRLQLTEAAPGAQTWLAQLNANLLQLNNTNGERLVVTLGETVGASEMVAIDSDGKAYLADSDHATAARRNALGVCLAGGVLDDEVVVQIRGVLTSVAHGLTPGSLLFLSETAGAFSTTAGATPRKIGLVVDADTLWFDCPSSWATS